MKIIKVYICETCFSTFNNKEDCEAHEAECNPKKKATVKKQLPDWAQNYDIYLSICKKAYYDVLNSKETINSFLKDFPNSDFEKTMQNIFDYWINETLGYAHKKKNISKQGKGIDMVATFKKSLKMKFNVRYKPFNSTSNGVSKTNISSFENNSNISPF